MAETPPHAKPATDEAPDRPAPKRRPADREPLWRDALGECLRHLRHERGEKLENVVDRSAGY